MLLEPAGLTVSREFEIRWKKQTLDLAELAFLRFELKLKLQTIATRMNAPQSTVTTAVHRLKKERGLK